MTVAVVAAVIGAAGTVLGAWIQARAPRRQAGRRAGRPGRPAGRPRRPRLCGRRARKSRPPRWPAWLPGWHVRAVSRAAGRDGFWFGQEADGSPSAPWGWDDLE